MIKTFREKHTEKLWKEKTDRRWKNIQEITLRKLDQLNKAKSLFDLTIPPHNRLETLRGEWRAIIVFGLTTNEELFLSEKKVTLKK